MLETENMVVFLKNWLSQWHKSPFIDCDGQKYVNAEQYMMAEKARLFGDEAVLQEILNSDSPSEHKSFGRVVKNFKQNTWDLVKTHIVFMGNLFKFSQSPILREKLLATGTKTIVEANPRDTVWGVGLSEDDPLVLDPTNWKGQNLLGKTLMRVRWVLKTEID